MPIDPIGLLLLSPILAALVIFGVTLLLDQHRLAMFKGQDEMVLTTSVRARLSDYLSGTYMLLLFSPILVLAFIGGPRWELLLIFGVAVAGWLYFWLPSVSSSRTLTFNRSVGLVFDGKTPLCRVADITVVGVGLHQRWRPQRAFWQTHSLYFHFRSSDGEERSYTIDRGGGSAEYSPIRDALADFLGVEARSITLQE